MTVADLTPLAQLQAVGKRVADGIHSTVRTLAIGGPPPRYAGQMAWRSITPTRPRGLDDMRVVMGDGCFFGLVPIGGGRTYGFGGLDAAETAHRLGPGTEPGRARGLAPAAGRPRCDPTGAGEPDAARPIRITAPGAVALREASAQPSRLW